MTDTPKLKVVTSHFISCGVCFRRIAVNAKAVVVGGLHMHVRCYREQQSEVRS